jgi:NAD(P)-dependent dehydrogenase (short-subunit alcohol dehydrogenase family)
MRLTDWILAGGQHRNRSGRGPNLVGRRRILSENRRGPLRVVPAPFWLQKTPLGRLGRVVDIAPLAVFLASDESAWITGEVIRAAGGLVVAT